MTKHIVFRAPRKSPTRTSPCVRYDGRPKFRFESCEAARQVARSWRNRRRGEPEAYQCDECGWWHLGNIYLQSYTRRVLDREPALLVELGERAVTQMMIESHGGRPRRLGYVMRRFRRLSQRQ